MPSPPPSSAPLPEGEVITWLPLWGSWREAPERVPSSLIPKSAISIPSRIYFPERAVMRVRAGRLATRRYKVRGYKAQRLLLVIVGVGLGFAAATYLHGGAQKPLALIEAAPAPTLPPEETQPDERMYFFHFFYQSSPPRFVFLCQKMDSSFVVFHKLFVVLQSKLNRIHKP